MTPPDWNWDAAGVAAAGFGVLRGAEALTRLVIGWWKDRDESQRTRQQDEGARDILVSDKLREQIREMYERLDVVDERLNAERERRLALVAEIANLKSENHQIRGREHQIRGYLTTLVLTAQRYHRQLGYPEEEMPRLPAWVNDPIPGPTIHAAASAPTGD